METGTEGRDYSRMNSARDKAENIIDELQAYLNLEQDGGDSLHSPSSDFDVSFSSSTINNDTTTTNNNNYDKSPVAVTGSSHLQEEIDRVWESFNLPTSLFADDSSPVHDEQSKLPQSSEFVMTSAREEVAVKETTSTIKTSFSASTSKSERIERSSTGDSVTVNGYDGHSSPSPGSSPSRDTKPDVRPTFVTNGPLSLSDEERKANVSTVQHSSQQSVTGPSAVVVTSSSQETVVHTIAETGESERLAPPDSGGGRDTAVLPPPREFKDSAMMPFPMIFRRSKKDPGSKEYNVLVKELEQVLDKRNEGQDGPGAKVQTVTVASSGSAKRASGSLDNVSVFSNKALLDRLESHFKSRARPLDMTKPFATNDARGKKEDGTPAVSPSKAEPAVSGVTETRTYYEHRVSESSQSPPVPGSGRDDSGNKGGQGGEEEGGKLGQPPIPQPVAAAGGRRVNTEPSRPSEPPRPVPVIHIARGPTAANGHGSSDMNLSPSSRLEHESFTQDMSFGSEDDCSIHATSASPHDHHGHLYSKHHVHAHVHHSRTTNINNNNTTTTSAKADKRYRSQTLDPNFTHITRIAVSKSADSIPGAVSYQDQAPPQWTVERQNSVPMKTIVEHYSETDPEEVQAWNAAIKSNRKHKDKGVYRSLSQRMVQKIYRFVRPKSASAVSIVPSESRGYPDSQGGQEIHYIDVKNSHKHSHHHHQHQASPEYFVEFPKRTMVRHVMSSAPDVTTTSTSESGHHSTRMVVNGAEPRPVFHSPIASGLSAHPPARQKASFVTVSPHSRRGPTTPTAEPVLIHAKTVARTRSLGSKDASVKKAKNREPSAHPSVYVTRSLPPSSQQPSPLPPTTTTTTTNSSLTVEVPRDVRVENGSGSIPAVITTHHDSVAPGRKAVTVSRSSSHRQTYRPAQNGKSLLLVW